MQLNSIKNSRRLKAYLAGPLFSDAERTFNMLVAHRLEKIVEVYLPQRDGGLMSEMISDGVSPDKAACQVFGRDLSAIHSADFLIAILDGRAIDEGVAFELGVAFSSRKRCVGLQTDSRRLASWGNNPMITGALEIVFDTVEPLFMWMRNEVSTMSDPLQAMTHDQHSGCHHSVTLCLRQECK